MNTVKTILLEKLHRAQFEKICFDRYGYHDFEQNEYGAYLNLRFQQDWEMFQSGAMAGQATVAFESVGKWEVQYVGTDKELWRGRALNIEEGMTIAHGETLYRRLP